MVADQFFEEDFLLDEDWDVSGICMLGYCPYVDPYLLCQDDDFSCNVCPHFNSFSCEEDFLWFADEDYGLESSKGAK